MAEGGTDGELPSPISSGPTAQTASAPSMEQPDKIKPVETSAPYARDLTIELEPYTVAVIEIIGG